MKRKEFLNLIRLAEVGPRCIDENGFISYQILNQQLRPFDGIALHKNRVMATENDCISWIRYQCLQLNGMWDYEELDRCAEYSKRVDII